jgi:hypothetical protein
MVTPLYRHDSPVDLNNPSTKRLLKQLLIEKSKPLVFTVLQELDNNNFSFSSYPLTAERNSGLTGLAGIYLLISKTRKKIYLGGGSNLALRKADYNRNFNNPSRSRKVYPGMRQDVLELTAADFYFVPLAVFSTANLCGFPSTETTETTETNPPTVNQLISSFLDREVEFPLLDYFLSPSTEKSSRFYNVKREGRFQPGNTYGGAPESGSMDQAVKFENYVWESVSAAASSLSCDRKTIRNYRSYGVIQNISNEQFNNFTTTNNVDELRKKRYKISNSEAEGFFNDEQKKTIRKKMKSARRQNPSSS